MLNKNSVAVAALAVAAAAFPYAAMAGLSYGLGGLEYDFAGGGHANARLTLSYGVQMRMKNPKSAIAGSSDGDGNFQRNDLTSNNIQALLQANVSKGNSGIVFSATDFHDFAYHRPPHREGKPTSTPGPTSRFPRYTRYINGGYARVLDAYAYSSFDTGGGTLLTLKLGNQVVNWGNMNFFPDMATAQGPFDSVKGDMPGAQTQAILLPERQLSATFSVNNKLTLLADYQFGFHPTVLPGVGSYFSTSNFSSNGDALGASASCGVDYNPLIPACPAGGYQGSNHVSSFGQYGLGARYQATRSTSVGVYYLHFNDRTTLPNIKLPTFAFTLVNQTNEDLVGLTTSTVLQTPQWLSWAGSMSVATETTYRWHGTVLRGALGTPTRDGHYLTAGVDVLDNLGNTVLSPLTTLLFEVSGQYVGGTPTSKLTYKTRTAGAAHVQLALSYPGVIAGWDLSVPFNYAYQFNGRTLFGPTVAGEGVHGGVYSVGASATWHQNLNFDVSYQGYTGGVDTRTPSAHALVDRDFASFTVTYTF